MKPRIREAFLSVNKFSRPGTKLTKVRKLVFHWTGNPLSSARATRNYFESLKDGSLYASAQFCVDDDEIVQCMPFDEIAYHAGPNTKLTPWAKEYFNDDVHPWALGVEHSHPDWTGKFAPKTLARSVELFGWLCRENALDPIDDIVMHWHTTGKDCPRWFVSRRDEWNEYKRSVARYMEGHRAFTA